MIGCSGNSGAIVGVSSGNDCSLMHPENATITNSSIANTISIAILFFIFTTFLLICSFLYYITSLSPYLRHMHPSNYSHRKHKSFAIFFAQAFLFAVYNMMNTPRGRYFKTLPIPLLSPLSKREPASSYLFPVSSPYRLPACRNLW